MKERNGTHSDGGTEISSPGSKDNRIETIGNGAVCAILVAAGRGARSGHSANKVLAEVRGVPILVRAAAAFLGLPADERAGESGTGVGSEAGFGGETCVGSEAGFRHQAGGKLLACVVVVAAAGEEDLIRSLLASHFEGETSGGRLLVCAGGEDRQASVRNGLDCLMGAGAGPDDTVLVHDAARPFIDAPSIRRCVEAVRSEGAACVGVPVKDTIKVVVDGMIRETPDRATLWQVQTPQGFRAKLLLEAHSCAEQAGLRGTDDAMLVERLPHPVRMVAGDYTNIKITTPEDFRLAEALAESRDAEAIQSRFRGNEEAMGKR